MMAKTSKIYINKDVPHVDIPNIDLLTLLFNSEHSLAQPETLLHVDAAHPDNKLSKTNLCDLYERIAHGLRHHYAIGRHGPDTDVVTVLSYGQILVPAVFFGVVAAGGIYSAASPSSTVAELARQIEIGNSNLVICGSEHKDLARQAAKQCGVAPSRILVMESWPTWSLTSLDGHIDALSKQRLPWQSITDPVKLKKSIITILWSSGTTGLPKGVQLSHRNLVAETMILSVPNRMYVAKLLETDPSSYTPIEYRTLAHLPISHIAGLFGYLIAPIFSGGTAYWMRKYNWHEFLTHMENHRITAFYTVPSIYLRISKSPDVKNQFKHVVAANTGAAPMDSKLQTASNSRMGDGTTTFIGQTWGLSETTGAVTAIPAGQTDTTGCIGFVLPNCELRIVDDNFDDVDPGQEGELLIRAPVVMEAYFKNEKATKEAFHDFGDGTDPWFCSGDIGVMRDGKFYVVDRKKELLKYKGLQVAPAELENLLFTHPAVAEAAVVGVPAPDDPTTDLPRAYVVLNIAVTDSTERTPARWPASPALEAQAIQERATENDSSKLDTLSQTRYFDQRNQSTPGSLSQPPLLTGSSSSHDSSKEDTLRQTRYTDPKSQSPGNQDKSNSEAALVEELKKYVADRLAPHKQLRGGVKFVSEIPKNAIGKFLRRDLRERAKKEILSERGTGKEKAKL